MDDLQQIALLRAVVGPAWTRGGVQASLRRMRFMGVIVIAAAAVLATGCATRRLRSASAGSVGCAPRDIEIGNTSRRLTGRTWTAECHGAVYQCSGLGTDVTCSPLRESVASSERPSSMGVPSSAGAAADARRREELLGGEREAM